MGWLKITYQFRVTVTLTSDLVSTNAGLSQPFLGMGPGPVEFRKFVLFRPKFGQSIARLIPIVNLTLFLDI